MIQQAEGEAVCAYSEKDCCTLLSLSGCIGDYIVTTNTSQEDEDTVCVFWINICGLGTNVKHIGVPTAGGSLHSAMLKSYDEVNDLARVQWVESGVLQNKYFHWDEIVTANPRLAACPSRVPLRRQGDVLCFPSEVDPDMQTFRSIEDVLSFINTPAGRRLGNHLQTQRNCSDWTFEHPRSHESITARDTDCTMPSVINRDQVESLFKNFWCQTGDFVVRLVEHGEFQVPNCMYVISFLGAVRVHHVGIVQTQQLFHLIGSPLRFGTLSALIDDIIQTGLIEGVYLRRAVYPTPQEIAQGLESSRKRKGVETKTGSGTSIAPAPAPAAEVRGGQGGSAAMPSQGSTTSVGRKGEKITQVAPLPFVARRRSDIVTQQASIQENKMPTASVSDPDLSSGSAYIDLGMYGSTMVSKEETSHDSKTPSKVLPCPWLVVSKEPAPAPRAPQAGTSWADIIKANYTSSFQSYLDDVYI